MNETKKSEFFSEMARPFLVLVVICLVAAALLGVTNHFTKPVIEENERITAENTRKSVLPQATGFVEVAVPDGVAVTSIYMDEGGSGYVITAGSAGYGGDVVATIGFDMDGAIVGISVNASTETQGVGTKAGDPAYYEAYLGMSDSADGVELISGATYSSTALRAAVNAAFDAFAAIQ